MTCIPSCNGNWSGASPDSPPEATYNCRLDPLTQGESIKAQFWFFFSRHGGVDPASLTFVANQLDCVLLAHGASCDSGTGDEEAERVIQVYNALCKQIRALDLPLNVNSIQGISSVFRGAEVGKRIKEFFSISSFLLHCQYIFKQSGDENKEIHQQGKLM